MDKELNICLIEPVGGHGGMDYYDYGLSYGLGENGINVKYHTCSKTGIRKFKNVTTFHTFKNFWVKPSLFKLAYFIRYYYKAIKIAKKDHSDFVHLHFFSFSIVNLFILIITKCNKLKPVVTVHDINSFSGASSKWIEKISYKFIEGVIVHNKSSYNELLNKKIKLPPLAIIPHGNYSPFVKQLPLPEFKDKINLLFFGQIKEVKGLDILIKAFAEVIKNNKNFTLTIAGRPWKTDIDKYEQLIRELGITNYVETHFKYIPDEEIENFYANSHIVVLPYKRIYQSGVLLLTMSYGRTVIASNLTAFNEIIIEDFNGFTFSSEDAHDLAKRILNLTPKNIIDATKMSLTTINKKYDWITIGKQTKDFYNSL